jgi:hypothetical protein
MLNCYCRERLIFLCFLWHWHHGWCSIRYTHWVSEWVSEWVSVVQSKFSKFSAISWREQVTFQWDDDDVHFVLFEHAELDFYIASSLKIEAQWSKPMSFTFHSALRKLNTDWTFYRCFHQSSVHLAKQFQRRRLLEIGQSETRIVCGDHVCQRIGMKWAIFIEDLP